MDLSQIRKKLAELEDKQAQQKSSNKNQFIWKPTPGKNLIRILPYKYRPENPFLELSFHYEVAGRTVVSPTSIDGTAPDPILEFVEKLARTGDKDDFKMSRKIAPKQRTFVPIIVRGQEEKGVLYYGFGQTIFTELLKIIDDPDYGDITDPRTGRDITIEYEAPTDKNKYGSTTIRVKPNTSPILSPEAGQTPEGKALMESIRNMPSIADVFPPPTYEDLRGMLEKYLSVGAEQEEEQSKDQSSTDDSEPESDKGDLPWEKGQGKGEKKKSATAAKKNVAEAFDDLFSM